MTNELKFPVIIHEDRGVLENFAGNLSTPNRPIRIFFDLLRDSVQRSKAHSGDPESVKSKVALSIILAVISVETFLNAYFRILVEEKPFRTFKAKIMEERRFKPLDYKLREWPKTIFGSNARIESVVMNEFRRLKNIRNKMVHFDYEWHTMTPELGVIISGLADTTVYDSLNVDDAISALNCAESVVAEICKLRGTPEEEIPIALQTFTGKSPF